MTTDYAPAEDYATTRPVGWKMESGFESIERLDDLAGEPNFAMTNEQGETWCGGVAEAAAFLVNALAWEPGLISVPQPPNDSQIIAYELAGLVVITAAEWSLCRAALEQAARVDPVPEVAANWRELDRRVEDRRGKPR